MKKIIAMCLIMSVCICKVSTAYASEIKDEENEKEEQKVNKETIGTGKGEGGVDKWSSSFGVTVTYEAPEPEPVVISVDLSWGDMLFDYVVESHSTWNSKKHNYDVKKNGKWVVRNDNGNVIKITNNSIIDIDAKLGWNKVEEMDQISGGFYNKINSLEQSDKITELANVKSVLGLNAEQKEKAIKKAYFNISGSIDENQNEDVNLGEVTIVIK